MLTGVALAGAHGGSHLPGQLQMHNGERRCMEPSETRREPTVPRDASHSSPVNSVACSPDGKRVVSGSYDKLIKIWDVATGAEVSSYVLVRYGC